MHRIYAWRGLCRPDGHAIGRRAPPDARFNLVQLRDALQGFACDGRLGRFVELVEFATRMDPAGS